ncbi:hypothetical protein PanWU01x14_010500, partial [Parasponia andersonii]
MSELRKEKLGQLGTAAIFWLIIRAFFSMLPRLRLSFSLQITLPNHRDQKKASDYRVHEDDPHVRGSHELHHRHENESLDGHDQHYLDLEAQDQTTDLDPKWDRRSHAQKKEKAVMMTLRPLPMEAIMVPYNRSGGLIITDSLSFPRYHFKNSSFRIGESSSRSVSSGNDDKSSFSLSTSTTTTGSTTSNSSVVSSPLSSSSKYGRKPFLPKDYSPNSTKIGHLHVHVRENDQNQTRSPLHDPLTTRHNIFRKQELSKLLFAVAVGFLPGIFNLHHSDPQNFNWFICSVIALLLGVGVGFLWNGNVLHEDYPMYAHLIQMLGYALVLGAFFCTIARFLWPEKYLFPIPLVCYAISL